MLSNEDLKAIITENNFSKIGEMPIDTQSDIRRAITLIIERDELSRKEFMARPVYEQPKVKHKIVNTKAGACYGLDKLLDDGYEIYNTCPSADGVEYVLRKYIREKD